MEDSVTGAEEDCVKDAEEYSVTGAEKDCVTDAEESSVTRAEKDCVTDADESSVTGAKGLIWLLDITFTSNCEGGWCACTGKLSVMSKGGALSCT